MIWVLIVLVIIGFFVGSGVYWIVLAILGVGYLIAYAIEQSGIRQSAAIQNHNSAIDPIDDYVTGHVVEDWEVELHDNPAIDAKDLTDEELWQKALELVFETKKASTSLLQRRFRIGYGRAARLIEKMEEEGIIGPADGAHPRKILITKKEFEK